MVNLFWVVVVGGGGGVILGCSNWWCVYFG